MYYYYYYYYCYYLTFLKTDNSTHYGHNFTLAYCQTISRTFCLFLFIAGQQHYSRITIDAWSVTVCLVVQYFKLQQFKFL